MAALATPALIINNVVFPIKPNTLMYKEGQGEDKIRVASLGGRKVETLFTKDVETMRGMIKSTVYTTAENINEARRLKDNEDTNVVQLVDGSFTRTFNRAAMINDPEKALGVEGEFEVEFESDPAV
jgi:hypothetical protein